MPRAQFHCRFGGVDDTRGIEAHLVQQRAIGERDRLAVLVIQPLRERNRLFRVGHRGILFAEQPECVRVPGMCEDAEVGPQRGALRIRFVVCGQ